MAATTLPTTPPTRHPDAALLAAYAEFSDFDRHLTLRQAAGSPCTEAELAQHSMLERAVTEIEATTPAGLAVTLLMAIRAGGGFDCLAKAAGWDGASRPAFEARASERDGVLS